MIEYPKGEGAIDLSGDVLGCMRETAGTHVEYQDTGCLYILVS